MNTWDFVYSCGCDIEFASQRAKELDNIIDAEAEKRSIKKGRGAIYRSQKRVPA